MWNLSKFPRYTSQGEHHERKTLIPAELLQLSLSFFSEDVFSLSQVSLVGKQWYTVAKLVATTVRLAAPVAFDEVLLCEALCSCLAMHLRISVAHTLCIVSRVPFCPQPVIHPPCPLGGKGGHMPGGAEEDISPMDCDSL